MGYIFDLRIDRIGFIKNCKRRLGHDYQVLYVKGDKQDGEPVWREHAVELFNVSRR